MAWRLLPLLVLLAVGDAAEPDQPVGEQALPLGWSAAAPALEAISPGREKPSRPAQEGVIELTWDDYRTVIVIGPGSGTVRPAWVLTYQLNRRPDRNPPPGAGPLPLPGPLAGPPVAPGPSMTHARGPELAVAYRATAFLDRHGILHLDAREALVVGAQAANWSPDSFAIYATGAASTLDDRGDAEHAGASRCVPATADEYHTVLMQAQSLVNDGA